MRWGGFWAEEVAESHRVLTEAGIQVDIATPGGVRPPADPVSLDERGGVEASAAERFRDHLDTIADRLARPLDLAEVEGADYDAIYLPGGHGPMEDLARDADLGRLLAGAVRDGRIVAALCHGPAALLSTAGGDAFPFAGRRLTVFTDDEERQGGLAVPYFVESRLRDLGAIVEPGPAWTSKVVVDGALITGQNPQSTVETARQVVKALTP
ncbi:type 1 glutamine amidotransferase domain-containing protein [Spirillospora albida]|uniref:type 1 glutamine amidotransferase domain-containing protein n=1 Tax=Spirillospora albida TaxID=58123 RepID=UPI00068CBDBC|nr:type 1 glutamine amidotransferase domain-containing protein [Spirillospora albida]